MEEFSPREVAVWDAVYGTAWVRGASMLLSGVNSDLERSKWAIAEADRAVAALRAVRAYEAATAAEASRRT